MIRLEVAMADTYEVELVATELVSNVIRHANTEFVVSVETDENTVRVEVSDGSAIRPAVRDLSAGIDATGGVGLQLVEAISEKWGFDHRPDGKVVWAEIVVETQDTENPGRR
jgi:phosphoserine phosphatase RsbU/P